MGILSEPRRLISVLVLCYVGRGLCDDVLVFTDEDFDRRIKEHSIALVKFYSPWCGHCKALAPEFESAASSMKFNNPPVAFVEVDCSSSGKKKCSQFDVKGLPTLKIFTNGELSSTYDGPRDADGIVGYMKIKVSPASKELKTPEDFVRCLSEIDNVVIGFFESRDSDTYKVFQKLSETLKHRYRFAVTFSNKCMTKYGYRNDIVLFRSEKLETKLEQSQIKFEGIPTLYELRSWVTNVYHGLVGFRTQRNKEQFEAPFVVVYCDVEFNGQPMDTRYWRNRVMIVAKKFTQSKRKVTFALSDAKEFRQELVDFSLDPLGSKPLVAARDASQHRYALRADFSMEALEQFAEDLLSGALKPFIRSDPVPLKNDGHVKVIVRTNFEEVVNDPSKDVLLELHAPWCEVCRNVAEKLEEVAEKLQNESGIVIARMDVTTNELPRPFYMKGYPSLYFVPKNSKSEPKLYQGGFAARDFLRFVAAESTEPLQGYDRQGRKIRPVAETEKPVGLKSEVETDKPDRTEL